MKLFISFLLLLSLIFSACTPAVKKEEESSTEKLARQEARDDSLELVAAYNRQAKIEATVFPSYETDEIASDNLSDAADDPAIWVHPTKPEKSIIIGSNKRGGIHLYQLTGEEIAYFPIGNVNNVDLISDFKLGEKSIVLLGGSNRSDQSIDLLMLDPEKPELLDIAADDLKVNPNEIDDIYGFCFYQESESEQSYVFINGKNGRVQQFELIPTESGKVGVRKLGDIFFDSQVEGMVADEAYGLLYVGEEGEGIWKVEVSTDGRNRKTLISQSGEDNPAISYDIEGLAIYENGKEGYLLASSQGNFSYAVFERTGDNEYLGSFKIVSSDQIDGAEETDGIEVSPAAFGEKFPSGILVVQDGFNYEGDSLKPQNFKIVDWREIGEKLQLPEDE